MKYIVAVHAIAESGEAVFVGLTSVSAPSAREAKSLAIEALWEDRLTSSSCRAQASVIGWTAEDETAAVRAARSTRSYLEESQRASAGLASEDEWRWYRFWWTWTAVRFSSTRQDRARAKLGSERFYRRLERVKAWHGRVLSGGTAHAA